MMNEILGCKKCMTISQLKQTNLGLLSVCERSEHDLSTSLVRSVVKQSIEVIRFADISKRLEIGSLPNVLIEPPGEMVDGACKLCVSEGDIAIFERC
jgi:hypothetical protein